MRKKKYFYVLYRGDKFIDLGTKEYLAKLLNVIIGTLGLYQSPSYHERTNYKGYIVIKIEEE